MATLEEIFNEKLTENGDIAYKSTPNKMLDLFFMSEYYSKHLKRVKIGKSIKERIFSMFMRDPRNGMGFRDLGRELMWQTNCLFDQVVKAGRFDDLLYKIDQMDSETFDQLCHFLWTEITYGNELCKKWMPRYSSKNRKYARRFAKAFGMTKQQYGHFIKANTTESHLTNKTTDEINFESVPSQAMLKYSMRFANGDDTKERFEQFVNDVKNGKKDLKVSTTTVYDIYKNRLRIDPDMFFDKIEKISGSWIPIVDTSASMQDSNDSIGKAYAIGHYLSKCSSYAPDKVISFSSRPQLITLGESVRGHIYDGSSKYLNEIKSMYTGDCSNTDLGKVMKLLEKLYDMPEYLVVLSDMEFDKGSLIKKNNLMRLWKKKGYTTKIIWWNFNSRNTTCPETDKDGNIFISGYSPMLLKYLEAGFDGTKFLDKLLKTYAKKIGVLS